LVATLDKRRSVPRRRGRHWGRWLIAVIVSAVLVSVGVVVVASDDGGDKPPSAPVEGMFLSQSELQALPRAGSAWDEVVTAANGFQPTMTDYTNQDSTDATYALAAALVAARTGDSEMRDRVAEAIRSIASRPYDTTDNPSALGWARSMTSWVVAGDLIGLGQLDPGLDDLWQQFLRGMPQYPYAGDGGNSLLDLALTRANNVGAVARSAVTAIAIYTGDDRRLHVMADLYRAWVEGSGKYRFDWDSDKDRSWQCLPGSPSTYRGINPTFCTRDGNNLGGVLPEEFRRNGEYNADDYPGPSTTKYPWEALGAAVAQAYLLVRAGYSDALEWGDEAPRRALDRLWYLHSVAADDGWTFGRAAEGGSDDRWIIPFVNAIYDTSFLEPDGTGHGRPLSWTAWAHP
jgi:hypothetical protein